MVCFIGPSRCIGNSISPPVINNYTISCKNIFREIAKFAENDIAHFTELKVYLTYGSRNKVPVLTVFLYLKLIIIYVLYSVYCTVYSIHYTVNTVYQIPIHYTVYHVIIITSFIYHYSSITNEYFLLSNYKVVYIVVLNRQSKTESKDKKQ